MRKIGLFGIFVIIFSFANAQSFSGEIKWQKPVLIKDSIKSFYHLNFKEALFFKSGDAIPQYHKVIEIPFGQDISKISFSKTEFIPANETEIKLIKQQKINYNLKINHYTTSYANKNFLVFDFYPIKKLSENNYQKLKDFTIEYELSPQKKLNKSNAFADHSVLSNGKWIKVAVNSDGIYKMTYDELISYGVADKNGARVFTGYHGVLPETFTQVVSDDLKEIAIYINKGNDGIFNSGDYILFYGQGPNTWNYDTITGNYRHHLHNYSNYNYYFITSGNPKTIQNINPLPESSANTIAKHFTDCKFHEVENENLIESGKMFVGEKFIPTYNSFNFSFVFSDIDTDENINIYGNFVARSAMVSFFKLTYGSNTTSVQINQVTMSSYIYAAQSILDWDLKPSSSTININVKYQNNPAATDSKGWLDYLGVVAKRKLIISNNAIQMRTPDVAGQGKKTSFSIAGASSGYVLWDVSNPFDIKKILYDLDGSKMKFTIATEDIKKFYIFNSSGIKQPVSISSVLNQDLHDIANYDFIIITHPKFINYANELAEIHRNHDGISVTVLKPGDIYNEFSGGKPDVSAIRNFLKMIYEKTNKKYPKNVLLFGDGSFDNRTSIEKGNSNYILTYESRFSLTKNMSYVSDDFYAILEDNATMMTGVLNIGIGRFTVKTETEAISVINKIKSYLSNTSLGSWRNMITFIADDGDAASHLTQADDLAQYVSQNHKIFNIEKIYFDAYKEISTPSGERYPDVNRAFKERMNRGALIINYAGHGNEYGLAHERILSISDITSWHNPDHYPMFFTATCEFTRWDNYNMTTAGEYIFINPYGGAIGMFTTTRLVYSIQNFMLSQSFYYNVFGIKGLTLGEMIRSTKNLTGNSINKRNFSLIGDPALKLNYPNYNIIAKKVNHKDLPEVDTLKAMTRIEIEGIVADIDSNKINFNGIVYPVVYDKFKTVSTLGNGDNYPIDFDVQNSILFKGKSTVSNGNFKFSFIVPKDIAYNYGYGKLSFYAKNDITDAGGYNAEIVIGGTSDSAITDNKGPDIELYLNDESFITGGLTNQEPILIAKLFDKNGINTVGNGVGHDLSVVIDGNTSETIILNDFYESETDNYKKGSLNYQLPSLSQGTHTLKLKAWDVLNNSSEAYIDFVVAESTDLTLDHIFNYPNPFTTNTNFYFDHNMPNINLNVMINILTISGKIVKTLETTMNTTGYRSNPIQWNGLDDYGDKIGKGVYIYKLTVRTPTGDEVSEYQKLVILR